MERYYTAISDHTRTHWVPPFGTRRDLSCTVEVSLMPGGEVRDVVLARSSGDPAFDRSVIAAVFKASPLPVPRDHLFSRFRLFNFEFKAEH